MKKLLLIVCCSCFFYCKREQNKEQVVLWKPYDDATEVAANKNHEIPRMRYKLIQSKVLDKNTVFLPLYDAVSTFSETEYQQLKPLILEQNIPNIQKHIQEGKLTYEKLVLFYLHRMYTYELNNATTLNTVIALNKNVLIEARKKDKERRAGMAGKHPIYGMPVLLKDNINTAGMNTTAGAIALMNNEVDDAVIVKHLKENGALILGKVNLSEWAYFLCDGCPVGYSAVGGQTLNPYGRRVFETGGSSSGSGTAMAANYAVAAVGTETSGSILSPSSQNSVVGLKPTIGLLSGAGIVPISSTLDTPGPMTRNTIDNSILLSAMMGNDTQSSQQNYAEIAAAGLQPKAFAEMRLGVMTILLESDTLYGNTVERLKKLGAKIIEFTPPKVELEGFLSILNIDMRNDLPAYLNEHVKDTKAVTITSVADVIAFNAADSLVRIPYGQKRFEGIMADTTSSRQLKDIKKTLERNGRLYFDKALDTYNLDAVLSINNYHAGYAAVAKYPALTLPMGYRETGEPVGLTFIAKPYKEVLLLQLGAAFETEFCVRKMPDLYH